MHCSEVVVLGICTLVDRRTLFDVVEVGTAVWRRPLGCGQVGRPRAVPCRARVCDSCSCDESAITAVVPTSGLRRFVWFVANGTECCYIHLLHLLRRSMMFAVV